jgi:hypothetical protein
MRKFGLFLIVLTILGIGVYFLMPTGETSKAHSTEGIDLIPKDAFLLLKSESFGTLYSDLENNRTISKFLELPDFNSTWLDVKDIQKTLSNQPWISGKKDAIHLSLHMTGKSSYAPLVVVGPINDFTIDPNQLKGIQQESSRVYEEIEISTLKVDSLEQSLFASHLGRFLVFSTSPVLVETAVRNYKYSFSLLQDKGFKKLLRTSDPQSDGNLFIHYGRLSNFLQIYENSSDRHVEEKLLAFGGWLEMDLNIKDNGVMMNGFSVINDSTKTFLNSFKNTGAQKFNAASVLPSNTAYISYMGWEDFDVYYKGFLEYLNTKQKLYTHESNIENINKKYKFDVKEDVFSWIGREMVVFITEGNQENVAKNLGLAIQVENLEKLNLHLSKIVSNTKGSLEVSEYLNYKIGDLNLTNLFPMLFGSTLDGIEKSNFVIIEDYIIFANDEGNLKHIINAYLRGSTLVKSIQFNKFMDNLTDLSSYFVYYNFKHAQNFPKAYLSSDAFSQFDLVKDSIKNLNAFAFQVIENNDLFFTNGYMEYKKIEESKTVSLIECKLDTSYSIKPWVVVNHYTKEKELLVQDNLNQLYLINNVGKILWKKKLDGPILGEVYQVDRYRNEKLQYVFGTGKSLHLVDRLGNNVDAFPTKLPSKQTYSVTVLDYDKNRDYRILVPAGNQLYNYGIDGKRVQGWDFKPSKHALVTAPKLLQQDKKDYIFFADASGNVRALNRRGEDRLEISVRLPENRAHYELWSNSTLSNSGVFTTDTNGTLFMLKLNNELEPITMKAFTSGHEFALEKFKGDGKDVLYFDEEKIYAFALSKNKLMEIEEIEFIPAYGIQVHQLKERSVVSVSDVKARKCYVYSDDGRLMEGFPLEAVTPALVDDLDKDGRFEFIVGDHLGSLYFYSIFQ